MNTNSGKHRWQKPSSPADSKTPFDCNGTNKARNNAHSRASSCTYEKTTFANANTDATTGPNASTGAPTGSNTNTGAHTTYTTHPFNSAYDQKSKAFSPLTSIAKIAGGALLALIGVPMLILPGPGLLFIGGGAALAFSGFADLKRAFV